MKNTSASRVVTLSLIGLATLSACKPEAPASPPVVAMAPPEPTSPPPTPGAADERRSPEPVTVPTGSAKPVESEERRRALAIHARAQAVVLALNATNEADPKAKKEAVRWGRCMATTCRTEFEKSTSVSALLIRALANILPLMDEAHPLDDEQVNALEPKIAESEKLVAQAAAKAKASAAKPTSSK